MIAKELAEILLKYPDCKVELTDPGSLMIETEEGWKTALAFNLDD